MVVSVVGELVCCWSLQAELVLPCHHVMLLRRTTPQPRPQLLSQALLTGLYDHHIARHSQRRAIALVRHKARHQLLQPAGAPAPGTRGVGGGLKVPVTHCAGTAPCRTPSTSTVTAVARMQAAMALEHCAHHCHFAPLHAPLFSPNLSTSYPTQFIGKRA